MRALALVKQRKQGEWGFTLVELMVAIVLSAIVMLGGGEMLRQLIMASARNTDATIAVVQVQNAGFWVGQDGVQAQAVECFDPLVDPAKRLLSLSWSEWDGTPHVVTYSVVDATDEVGSIYWQLMRHDSVTDDTIMISEFLDTDGTSCEFVDDVLILEVTAEIDGQSETRTFEIQPRSLQ